MEKVLIGRVDVKFLDFAVGAVHFNTVSGDSRKVVHSLLDRV